MITADITDIFCTWSQQNKSDQFIIQHFKIKNVNSETHCQTGTSNMSIYGTDMFTLKQNTYVGTFAECCVRSSFTTFLTY